MLARRCARGGNLYSFAAAFEGGERAEPRDTLTPEEAIKDPFVLEFLDLKDEYSESDLEDGLIRHMADFCWSSVMILLSWVGSDA